MGKLRYVDPVPTYPILILGHVYVRRALPIWMFFVIPVDRQRRRLPTRLS
jgi:hypothetical protein